MKGGCFGKILTFIFGVIVGIVLFAGTLAGGAYFLVAKVTINDVESVAKTEFTFIDSEAEIRDKSILDIVNMVTKGDIKNITVSGVKTTFGVDIIKIVEDTLDITIKEDGKAQLNELPVLQVFQDDNLKIVLNSITLRDVLTKAGIDFTSADSLGSKPVLAEHLDEPVIDGFNAILKSLNINDMTIAEMEYLLGISFGGEGILDSLADYKVSELNNAINGITLETIMPDFDRDLYFENGGTRYDKSAAAVEVAMQNLETYYDILADGASRVDGVNYYTLNDQNVLKLDNTNGTLYLKDSVTLPDFRERYGKDADNNYFSDRNGYYYVEVPAGTFASDRYDDAEGTVQNNFGRYVYVYTPSTTGEYTLGYAAVKGETGVTMVARKYMAVNAAEIAGYAEYRLNGVVFERKNNEEGADYSAAVRYNRVDNAGKYELVEDVAGAYALVHVGTSQTILKTLADETLNTLNGAMGDIKLCEVVDVDESDGILYELRNSTLSSIPDDIKNVKISNIMNIADKNIIAAAADGEYIALPAGNVYAGTYITAYTSATSETPVYVVKYRDGLGSFFTGMQRYNVTTKASNSVVAGLGSKTVGQLQTDGVDDLINSAVLSGVIDIDGDAYMLAYSNYTEAAASMDTVYVYYDAERDFFVENSAEYATATEFYEKVYTGGAETNQVIKKMANIKINDISTRMQKIIDETRLSEVLSVNAEYVLREATAAEISNGSIRKYVALKSGVQYYGTFSIGRIEGTNTEISFVREAGTLNAAYESGDGKQYVIVTEISSGVLIKMADKKIGEMTSSMQSVVNSSYLSDVIDISGDTYAKVEQTAFATAQAANVGEQLYYLDSSGLYLKAGYSRNADGTYVYYGGAYIVDDGNAIYDELDHYQLNGGAETTFFIKIFRGTSDNILRKIATITAASLGESGTMNKAINDCTLEDVGVAPTTDDGSLLYQIKDYRIDELSFAIEDICSNATMAQLNQWCGLGLTDADLAKSVTIMVGGMPTVITIGDMEATQFLRFAISLVP